MRSFLLLAIAAAVPAVAADFTGRFEGLTDDGASVVLTLRQAGDRVTGTLLQDGDPAPVSGRAEAGRLVAVAGAGTQALRFTAELEGDALRVAAAGAALTLRRAGAAAAAAREAPPPTSPRVVVNGVALDGAQMEDLQRRYGLRFGSGDFWYDRRTGGWGVTGGPTAGLVAPGIPMGGPLRRDASRGNTGVLVNGRELRAEEVLALRNIGQPVFPGRYWIDAQGNYGFEGGPPVGNLYLEAQARRAPREGILSTWDRTGVAVFGGR